MNWHEDPMKQAIANIDERKAERERETIESAYKKVTENIDGTAINPEDMSPPYSPEEIAKDKKYVEEIEREFVKNSESEKENLKYAIVLEGIVLDQITTNGWLGEHARARKTSRYDDIKNGIDIIVEFKKEDIFSHHVGLAIDATFGNPTLIQKKIQSVLDGIKNGELAKLKYFETENYKGVLNNIPRVIIGVDRRHVSELASLWNDDERQKELKKHPSQRIFLREAIRQLDFFAEFAIKEGKEELAPIFKQNAQILRSISSEKNMEGITTDTYEDDRVFNSILEQSSTQK